jgi:CRISPR-associated protein (TIGR03984 family)
MGMELANKPLEKKQVHCTGPEPMTCGLQPSELVTLLGQHMKHDASIVCWQVHRIIWGRWNDGQIELSDGSKLDSQYVVELRVFNQLEELYLRRKGDILTGHYISDEGGTKAIDCVDSISPLWGKNLAKTVEHGYVRLEDRERQLSLCVPCEKRAEYYGLVTRSYIGRHGITGQSGYVGYRFVAISAVERDGK